MSFFHNGLWKVDMYLLNPVLVQFFYDHADSFLGHDAVARLWQTVQPLDDKAAQGVVFLRIKIQIQPIV